MHTAVITYGDPDPSVCNSIADAVRRISEAAGLTILGVSSPASHDVEAFGVWGDETEHCGSVVLLDPDTADGSDMAAYVRFVDRVTVIAASVAETHGQEALGVFTSLGGRSLATPDAHLDGLMTAGEVWGD